MKRSLDIIGGLAGCILTGIIFIFVAPAIYIQSPGPVFFSQVRVGKNGKKFKMYKFRSMYMDAEERKKELTLQISEQLNIPLSEARYFISTPSIEKNMYDEADDSIDILYNDGSIKNIAEASDMLNISLLSKKVKKYYLCYQRLHR
mgnify:CR=1 FL=1